MIHIADKILISRALTLVTWSKGHVALRVGATHGKTATCLVWRQWIFCKWRYNVLNLSCHLPWPSYWWVMQIYESKLLAICHHHDRFCDPKHCDSGEIVFLSRGLTGSHIKRVMWIYGWKPLTVCHYLAMFGEHWSSTRGDIKYLICHVTCKTKRLKDHVTLWLTQRGQSYYMGSKCFFSLGWPPF